MDEFENFRKITNYLISLKGLTLDNCIYAFLIGLYSEVNNTTLIKTVAVELKKSITEKQSKNNKEINNLEEIKTFDFIKQEEYILDEDYEFLNIEEHFMIESSKIIDYLFQVLSFFEKSNFGFLSGDLSSDLIKLFNKILETGERNQGTIIKKVHTSFEEIGFNLPKFGIKNPTIENERNLFERQLLLEKTSFNVRYFI